MTTTHWPTTPDSAPPGARLAADLVDVDLAANRTFVAGVPHDAFDVLRSNGRILVAGTPDHVHHDEEVA